MKIEYETSVLVPAGWRSVHVTAEAHYVSAKMLEVDNVLLIDDEKPIGYTSRTGAKRQKYNAYGIAQREIGKRKRASSCYSVEEEKENLK